MDFMSYTWSDRTKYAPQPKPPLSTSYRPRRHCKDCGDALIGEAVRFNDAWYCTDCDSRNRVMAEQAFGHGTVIAKKPRHKKGA